MLVARHLASYSGRASQCFMRPLTPIRVLAAARMASSVAKPRGVGLAFAYRGARAAMGVARCACTVTGAVALGGLGFIVVPYVGERAPLMQEQRDALFRDIVAAAYANLSGGHPVSWADAWDALSSGQVPALTYRDLQQPWLFLIFEYVARLTFSMYSDAAGKMTAEEFQSSVHKMIDVVLEVQRQKRGVETTLPADRAATVRALTSRVAPGVFRVLDENGNGVIESYEFIRGVLVLLASVQGASADTPVLSGLAFRLVDADGDGKISLIEFTRWVALALEHGTAPTNAELEPRGPWGLFGMRTLTPAQLARKWLRQADIDHDGVLSPNEFAVLAPMLRVHDVIWSLARNFTEERLPPVARA